MTLSRLPLVECQSCKNRDGGLFFCPNCGREYPNTTLPSLLRNVSVAIGVSALAWVHHFLQLLLVPKLSRHLPDQSRRL